MNKFKLLAGISFSLLALIFTPLIFAEETSTPTLTTPILKLVNPNWYVNLTKGDRNFGRTIKLELENYNVSAENTQTWIKSDTDNDWVLKGVSNTGQLYNSFIIWVDPYKNYSIRMQVCQNGNIAYAGKNCGEFSNEVFVSKIANQSSDSQPNKTPESTPLPTIKPTIAPKSNTTAVTTSPTPSINDKKVDELNIKVGDLQNQLEQSKKSQNALEQRINELVNFIKRLFPFFK